MKTLNLIIAAALLFLAAQRQSLAGSATWATNATSGDWNTAANWRPQTVPNTSSDIATFATSNQKQIGISAITAIAGINFNQGADTFTIISEPGDPLTLSGSGIINSSGKLQTFLSETDGGLGGGFIFENAATAGDMTSFGGAEGSTLIFYNLSSAGSAVFDLDGGTVPSHMDFWDASTAANATITDTKGEISFFDTSTAANAHITVSGPSFMEILGDAHGGHVVATCYGGITEGTNISFAENATAEQGTYTAVGASAAGEFGSFIEFLGNATADHATFVINGGMGAGLEGTSLNFINTTTAANANITATGGVNGSDGGVISFQEQSKGSNASITLSGNAELDISHHDMPGVTIGSLAGQGSVFLRTNTLTVGSNDQSTTFSGVIQDSGGLTKSGSGTLTLTGNNLYTGSTTVTAGALVANNRRGSATGTGSVNVNAGTLGGKGIISGAVTIGTGSGSGGFLAPSVASNQPVALTCKTTLTLKADSTYSYKLNTNNARADQVIAKGVTIESGAQFDFNAVANKRLATGTVFTAISNTSANPISGTFANLPDHSTFTVGRNNYQASYEGGDGNDLILTVQ
jgi:autotransporter-associated beta strand protein